MGAPDHPPHREGSADPNICGSRRGAAPPGSAQRHEDRPPPSPPGIRGAGGPPRCTPTAAAAPLRSPRTKTPCGGGRTGRERTAPSHRAATGGVGGGLKGWWFPPPPKAPQPQRRSRCLCWVNGCRRCGGGSDKRFGGSGAAPLWADAALGPPLRVGPVTDARPHLWVRAYRRRPGPIYGSDPRPHPPLPTSHPADEAHTTSPTHPLYSAIGALRGHSRPHRPPHGSPTDPIGGGREVGGGLATNKL